MPLPVYAEKERHGIYIWHAALSLHTAPTSASLCRLTGTLWQHGQRCWPTGHVSAMHVSRVTHMAMLDLLHGAAGLAAQTLGTTVSSVDDDDDFGVSLGTQRAKTGAGGRPPLGAGGLTQAVSALTATQAGTAAGRTMLTGGGTQAAPAATMPGGVNPVADMVHASTTICMRLLQASGPWLLLLHTGPVIHLRTHQRGSLPCMWHLV